MMTEEENWDIKYESEKSYWSTGYNCPGAIIGKEEEKEACPEYKGSYGKLTVGQ